MPRSTWNGWISFGLVMIPVRLYPATAARDVRFKEFGRGTGRRVRHRRVVEEDDVSQAAPPGAPTAPSPAAEPPAAEDRLEPAAREREVALHDVVKGFEVEPGRFVMIEREELEALRPAPDRTIHIDGFVPLEQIDPVSFERSYYLGPGWDPQGRENVLRTYGLLLAALERAGRVGIGHFVMRTREYLAAVRPMNGILGLETLFFADEVRPASEVLAYDLEGTVSERELRVAEQLIDALATDWDPAAYTDRYRDRVMELIAGRTVEAEPALEEPAASPAGVADLLDVLRRSVEELRDRAGRPEEGRVTG